VFSPPPANRAICIDWGNIGEGPVLTKLALRQGRMFFPLQQETHFTIEAAIRLSIYPSDRDAHLKIRSCPAKTWQFDRDEISC
jgi:hypothetical protein